MQELRGSSAHPAPETGAEPAPGSQLQAEEHQQGPGPRHRLPRLRRKPPAPVERGDRRRNRTPDRRRPPPHARRTHRMREPRLRQSHPPGREAPRGVPQGRVHIERCSPLPLQVVRFVAFGIRSRAAARDEPAIRGRRVLTDRQQIAGARRRARRAAEVDGRVLPDPRVHPPALPSPCGRGRPRP